MPRTTPTQAAPAFVPRVAAMQDARPALTDAEIALGVWWESAAKMNTAKAWFVLADRCAGAALYADLIGRHEDSVMLGAADDLAFARGQQALREAAQ